MSFPKSKPSAEALAIASVPKQEWCEPYTLPAETRPPQKGTDCETSSRYDWATALKEGTIFPCLNLPFFKAPFGDSNIKPQSCGNAKPEQQRREEAVTRISEVSFAINDLTLYLDTHPDCKNGLNLFYQLVDERLKLLAQFAGEFYPLTQSSMVTGECGQNNYGWSEGPAPWEGACV